MLFLLSPSLIDVTCSLSTRFLSILSLFGSILIVGRSYVLVINDILFGALLISPNLMGLSSGMMRILSIVLLSALRKIYAIIDEIVFSLIGHPRRDRSRYTNGLRCFPICTRLLNPWRELALILHSPLVHSFHLNI